MLVVELLMQMFAEYFTVMTVVCAMVDAKHNKATALRINDPPAAIIQFLRVEKSRRFLLNIRNIAIAFVWGEYLRDRLFLFRNEIHGSPPCGFQPCKTRCHAAAFQARPHNPRGLRRRQSDDLLVAQRPVQFRDGSRQHIVLQAHFHAVRHTVLPLFIVDDFKLFVITTVWPVRIEALMHFIQRLKLFLQRVRNIHEAELPEVSVIMIECQADDAPTGRPPFQRRDNSLYFTLFGIRRRLVQLHLRAALPRLKPFWPELPEEAVPYRPRGVIRR